MILLLWMALAWGGETQTDVDAVVRVCEDAPTTVYRWGLRKELGGNESVTVLDQEEADDLYEAAVSDDLDNVAPGILGTWWTTLGTDEKTAVRTAILNGWADPDPAT